MTSSLPPEVCETFERFITTEFTTVGPRQQPITWPVTPYFKPGAASIDVTTGLGYPKKADDARRHPSVALLFSDPTGSGIDDGPRVLVQGTAEVDERDLDANAERYLRESAEKLPATEKMHPPKPIRGLIAWYYARIYIKVRPERVFVWPDGDVTQAPVIHDAHLEEVRSGHTEEPAEDHGRELGGEPVWDERVDELGERDSEAVVSWLAPDGFPLSARLQINVDRSAGAIALESEPAGLPLAEGRACLTAHAHHPEFLWQRNFQIRGDLERSNGNWRLVPHKLVGGFELPPGRVAGMWQFVKRTVPMRRRAKQRLRKLSS
jgi:hypothetical protein